MAEYVWVVPVELVPTGDAAVSCDSRDEADVSADKVW